MADLLSIGRATFFRKIKGQNIELLNKGNKDCEFCLRKKDTENIPSPSIPIITDDVREQLKNACGGHKYSDMAESLQIKSSTLRMYITRNKSKVFLNSREENRCCHALQNCFKYVVPFK